MKDKIRVEAKEERGDRIETDEDKLPSPAAAVHEQIRAEGHKELERDFVALIFSAIAAGLSIGISLIAKANFHTVFQQSYFTNLIESFGYTFGFIIVIMSKQQLFTENTLTAVLPVIQKPTAKNLAILLRLWGIVLLGNLIGTAVIAWVLVNFSVFGVEMQKAFLTLSQAMMEKSGKDMFLGGILSGWLIATMVWMFPTAGSAKIWVIILMTYIISICDLTHIVVGSVEGFYLIFTGHTAWAEFIYPFALPTLAGNILGGTFIFTIISHIQIRSDMKK
ncbi:formate/nitrite transporter family protein [Budvicia diplopodorum]|uniref:formate/nitrite transporter family protein n=1 Tax=Budvicia diplopodorum TaxID=1119056 RepID=UPI001356E140|nr:formate/nitrite transporter family protein [Budvicia diplopodorum]